MTEMVTRQVSSVFTPVRAVSPSLLMVSRETGYAAFFPGYSSYHVPFGRRKVCPTSVSMADDDRERAESGRASSSGGGAGRSSRGRHEDGDSKKSKKRSAR